MRITSSRNDKSIILILDGELNANTAPAFHDQLFGLIREGHRYLIMDCALLTHISSAGLRVFYQALDELEKANGKIIFCRVDQNIRRVFHVVNFTAEFPLFATLEEATQSIV